MILILIALIAAGVIGYFIVERCDNVIPEILGVVLMLGSAASCIVWGWSAWEWFAAPYKAAVINREYGTNYTREEIFWANSSIEIIRELDRKRIEVNGDVMRERSDLK